MWIPYIVLEGTPEDWKWILDHIDFFRSYGLDDWVNKIKPILSQIYRSSNGDYNKDFWNGIYKWNMMSGGNNLDGWFSNFFLYIKKRSSYQLNPNLKHPFDLKKQDPFIIKSDHIPSGLSKVDFQWVYLKDTFKMNIYGGFMGVHQIKSSKLLRAEISYAICSETADSVASNLESCTDYISRSCRSFKESKHLVNQEPIYKPLVYGPNAYLSHKALEEYLKNSFISSFDTVGLNAYVEIKFYVNLDKSVSDIRINNKGLSTKQCVFLEEKLRGVHDWMPAIIDGKQMKTEVSIDFYM